MSSVISTPAALKSRATPFSATYWRAVETQYVNATRKLVDSDAEQEVLEAILEDTKPPPPAAAHDLHYLYKTPFRYYTQAQATRFRGPVSHGLLYASESQVATLYEMLWHRLAFFTASPATPLPDDPLHFSVFDVPIATQACLNLSKRDFEPVRDQLLASKDYSASQAFAKSAREADCDVLIYPGVRDPDATANAALLTPQALAATAPTQQSFTWHIRLGRQEATIWRPFPEQRISVDLTAWDI